MTTIIVLCAILVVFGILLLDAQVQRNICAWYERDRWAARAAVYALLLAADAATLLGLLLMKPLA